MNDVRIIFLPRDVWQGVQAMGIAPAHVGASADEFVSRLSDQDLAAVLALQTLPAMVNAFGGAGGFSPTCRNDAAWNRITQIVRPLAESSYILDRLNATLGGEQQPNDPPITVVDLGPGSIGVIAGAGTFDALRKDNNVLTVLTAIVQKALVYGSVEALMASSCSAFVSRFVAVNAFANPNRPPIPVYR